MKIAQFWPLLILSIGCAGKHAEAPAAGTPTGGEASGGGQDSPAEGAAPGVGGAGGGGTNLDEAASIAQWFACQCGGPCEGAKEPPKSIRPECTVHVGRTENGIYEPCGGLTCGTGCLPCEPGSTDCEGLEGDPTHHLCSKTGDCLLAADASCL